MLFNACFTIQKHRIERLYTAIEATAHNMKEGNDWLRSMLFPTEADGSMQTSLNTFQMVQELADPVLNYEQLRAITTVVRRNYGQVPYLVTGPPGTGKTKTVVELALQLLAHNRKARLLICAPSDSAADTLALRLSKHLSPVTLLRLNSPSRSFPEVPISLMPFCHVGDRYFALPPFAELMKKRIVVACVRDAGILREVRVTNQDLFALEQNLYAALHPYDHPIQPPLHWDALIMDEAGQATEPEAHLPLLVIAPPNDMKPGEGPLFVMVGDQNQLGPRTMSKLGAIQTSLFERLLARPLYRNHPLARLKQTGGHIPRLTKAMLPLIRPPFTDLIRNYRSHAAIIAIPSSLFYNDTLEPAAQLSKSLMTWPGFQGRDMPIQFRDNRSRDEVEQDGGGWYNIEEANTAVAIAKSFLALGAIQPQDICIMSPFQAQVRVLRNTARAVALGAINIGPLEAYQGLEFRLVILCTTRTRDRFIDQDLARGQGVIHDSRRFNVALTRAMEALVVIGNPEVLSLDENWVAYLAFCKRNSCWEGEVEWEQPKQRSGKVRLSRLEKQIHARRVLDEEMEKDLNSVSNGMRRLGVGLAVDHEADAWEDGIAAEDEVLECDELEQSEELHEGPHEEPQWIEAEA